MPEIKGRLRVVRWAHGDAIAELMAWCPACDFAHSFRVDLDGHGKWPATDASNSPWTFNGDYDKPTFRASMGANLHGQEPLHPRCHSYLTDGVWGYLRDCTHDMANQEAELPPFPDVDFGRAHGWHLINPEKFPP